MGGEILDINRPELEEDWVFVIQTSSAELPLHSFLPVPPFLQPSPSALIYFSEKGDKWRTIMAKGKVQDSYVLNVTLKLAFGKKI